MSELKFYSKLHYYKHFYSEFIKLCAEMSWWTFYKVSRMIRKELPKYEPDYGKRIEWEVRRIYRSQKHDIYTGKPTGKKQLIRIDINGYSSNYIISKIKTKVFDYDIERGRLFMHGFNAKQSYADLHPTSKGFKIL